MTTTNPEAYAACRAELTGLDHDRCKAVLGITEEGADLVIPFYDEIYRLSQGALLNVDGQAPVDAVGLVLCRYLLNCPEEPLPEGRRLTFREIDGAGPLVSSFTTNTNKLITSAYALDLRGLEDTGHRMGGQRLEDIAGYDLVMKFTALPLIPIFLQFNAADDLFPAQSSLLFNASAQGYLDMQSLFILGTFLAGGLVGRQRSFAV